MREIKVPPPRPVSRGRSHFKEFRLEEMLPRLKAFIGLTDEEAPADDPPCPAPKEPPEER